MYGAVRSYRQEAHVHRWHCGKGSSRGQWDVRVGSLSVSSNHSRATLNQSQRRKRAAGHMSDQSTALLPFSMLTTYVPDGDQDTEFMAELQTGQKDKVY